MTLDREGVQIVVGVAVSIMTFLFGLVRALTYAFTSFHNKTIAPAITDVSNQIKMNTLATANVTTALNITNAAAAASQAATTHALMGLHGRLSVVEERTSSRLWGDKE